MLGKGMGDSFSAIPLARRNAKFSIVAHDGSFLWRAIPKNASTSLRKLLGPRGMTLQELDQAGAVTPSWSFAVVRHPERRVVSAWLNKLNPKRLNDGHAHIMDRHPDLRLGMPLEDFVDWLADELARPTPADPHWCPQNHFIFDKRGARLADHLVRFESLAADLSTIEDRIGPTGELKHHGGTGSEGVVVPSTVSRKLRKIYASDFELLAYD